VYTLIVPPQLFRRVGPQAPAPGQSHSIKPLSISRLVGLRAQPSLGTQREIREHFRSVELELGELDAKIPRSQYILDRQVRVHNELNRGWYRFQGEAMNQLNTLIASTSSPSETLVRLRAAQAAYFRFGLLLEVHVPPQALRGAAEFGPPSGADMANRLRGLCTPGLAAAAALALALQLGPHALASLRVGEIAPSGTTLELRGGERRVVPVASGSWRARASRIAPWSWPRLDWIRSSTLAPS